MPTNAKPDSLALILKLKSNMRFSERIGKRQIRTDLANDGLSSDLRNSLWTLIYELIIKARSNEKQHGVAYSDLSIYFRALWIHFFN